MKQVLLVNIVPTLRNYIFKKLADAEVVVFNADGVDQAIAIVQKTYCSLVIVDYTMPHDELFRFFDCKQSIPKAEKIPSIVIGTCIDKNEILLLNSYNVKKIIFKPLRIDELLTSIAVNLGISFQIDRTQSILEVNVNGEIIFIELAQGLNRDKLELLPFKLIELIELYKICLPKVVVIMTHIKLNYVDVSNVEYLIDMVLSVKSIMQENIKFLTLNKLVLEFFDDNQKYNQISVIDSLTNAVSSFSEGDDYAIINLQNSVEQKNSNLQEFKTCFKIDTEKALSATIVDDDLLIRKTLSEILYGINADIKTFENGEDFLNGFSDDKYDVVFFGYGNAWY